MDDTDFAPEHKQMVAILLSQRLGSELAKNNPEILDLYLTPAEFRQSLYGEDPDIGRHLQAMEGRTLLEIGEQFLADKGVHESVKVNAVSHALKELLEGNDERRKERDYRNTLSGYRNAEILHEFAEDGGRRRQELYPGLTSKTKTAYWDSVPPEERATHMRALMEARGVTPWSPEEKAYVIQLSENTAFHYQDGSLKGYRDLQRIADEVNRVHGNDRTKNAIVSLLTRHQASLRKPQGNDILD